MQVMEWNGVRGLNYAYVAAVVPSANAARRGLRFD